MSNREILTKYGFEDKTGLVNNTTKHCLCGTIIEDDSKVCPKCGASLAKNKLVNVNKNTHLAKRYEIVSEGGLDIYKFFHLLSNGFELYETEVFTFTINQEDSTFVISDAKMFKSIAKTESFISFVKTTLPGFMEYVIGCLGEFRYEYAVSNFGSMDANSLGNYLHVHKNYPALKDYLRGYKVYYYGKNVNLKKYLPDVDFTSKESVENSGIILQLLLTWDIKNEKYIESIINISKDATEHEKATISHIARNMLNQADTGNYWERIDYNEIIDTFSILYNGEISLQDFVRIANNSRDDMFSKLLEFRKYYKKLVSKKIDWSSIDKIDSKNFGILKTKAKLLEEKVPKGKVAEVYETLAKDPIEALTILKSAVDAMRVD